MEEEELELSCHKPEYSACLCLREDGVSRVSALPPPPPPLNPLKEKETITTNHQQQSPSPQTTKQKTTTTNKQTTKDNNNRAADLKTKAEWFELRTIKDVK